MRHPVGTARFVAKWGVSVPLAIATIASSRIALSKDVDAPLRVEITETSLFNYHTDNRNDQSPNDVEQRIDDNYGEWLNRFNVSATWKSFQAGLRLDTANYFHKPQTTDLDTPTQQRGAEQKLTYRYRPQLLVSPGVPSKLYLTYAKPDLEVTAGDAYVSFGRGLILSMRKIDELAVDTSLQGGKVTARLKPFALTLVGGLSNPVRVDEATGVTLRDAPPESPYAGKVWSRDLIVGARLEGKIGSSTIGLHAADVHRRDDLGFAGDPSLPARDIEGAGLSIAIPKLADAVPLNVYGEVAYQHRAPFSGGASSGQTGTEGYAAYAALSATAGAITASLEGKHYRGFYPVKANADPSLFGAFKAIQYNAPPTVEAITQDSLFDNSCTTGGRGRVDVRATPAYLVFGSIGYFSNWGERNPTACSAAPTLGITNREGTLLRNDTWDAFVGFELRSERDASYLLAQAGVRRDTEAETGNLFYRETYVQFDIVKTLDANYSLELTGRHRKRLELDEDWREGEDVFALKYTSARSIFVGHEYTTQALYVKRGAFLQTGSVQHFLNVGGQVKFSDAATVRVFLGQQRGALKCVSGVCRQFPAFEGGKVELILRY